MMEVFSCPCGWAVNATLLPHRIAEHEASALHKERMEDLERYAIALNFYFGEVRKS